jgi:hypothetical protein
MTNETLRAVQITAAILSVIYIALLYLAMGGYGYAGYRGFHNRASAWYWGGPTTYHEPSNRANSLDGTGRLGGGPGSGK